MIVEVQRQPVETPSPKVSNAVCGWWWATKILRLHVPFLQLISLQGKEFHGFQPVHESISMSGFLEPQFCVDVAVLSVFGNKNI
jgi:hypothetical protein